MTDGSAAAPFGGQPLPAVSINRHNLRELVLTREQVEAAVPLLQLLQGAASPRCLRMQRAGRGARSLRLLSPNRALLMPWDPALPSRCPIAESYGEGLASSALAGCYARVKVAGQYCLLAISSFQLQPAAPPLLTLEVRCSSVCVACTHSTRSAARRGSIQCHPSVHWAPLLAPLLVAGPPGHPSVQTVGHQRPG